MFDLRDKDDICRDIKQLYTLTLEYENYKQCLAACMKQCNIKEIVPCEKNHDITKHEGIMEKLNCPICKGTGLVVIFNEEDSKNGRTT